MELPWYGYVISGLVIWLTGFIAGRQGGKAEVLQGIMLNSAKMQQMPGFPPVQPPAPRG